MRTIIALTLFATAATPVASFAQAHVHGHGALDIAVEGSAISLRLEVPGADLVGFERTATTAQEIAAQDEARNRLGNLLALFGVPAAADCTVLENGTSLESGERVSDEHDHDHSNITVQLVLQCSNIAALDQLDLSTYFAAFPGSEHLEVNLITPDGASQSQLSAASSAIDLLGR
jgi:hypothetical protein